MTEHFTIISPVKAAIGYIRFIEVDRDHYRVEKMSYEEEDIDKHPDVILEATSSPCGIEIIRDGGDDKWIVQVGGNFHSRHEPAHSPRCKTGFQNARLAVIKMSVLDWLSLIPD